MVKGAGGEGACGTWLSEERNDVSLLADGQQN